MPYSVRKARGGGYNILNKATGRKVGHSSTKAKAKSSIRARNAAHHGWKGSKR